MRGSSGSAKTAIIVAIIGVIGVVLGSLINGYMQRPRSESTAQPADIQSMAAVPEPSPSLVPVRLTGARIGKVGARGHVLTHTTHFVAKDEVAITVRLDADPSVADFPVRVNATLFGGLNMYRADDSADIAVPGTQQLTFRFPPSEHRFDPLFLSVEIEGQKVYSQEISISYD